MNALEIGIIFILVIALIVFTILYLVKRFSKNKDKGNSEANQPKQIAALTDEEEEASNGIVDLLKGVGEAWIVNTALRRLIGAHMSSADQETFNHLKTALSKSSQRVPGKAFHPNSKMSELAKHERSVYNRFRYMYNSARVEAEEFLKYGIKNTKQMIKDLEAKGIKVSEDEAKNISIKAYQDAAEHFGIQLDKAAIEEIAAKRSTLLARSANPFGPMIDIMMLGGMLADWFDFGGFGSSVDTETWLKTKKDFENEVKDSYVQDPSLGGFWPEIIGPLSMLAINDTLDDKIQAEIMNIVMQLDNDNNPSEFMMVLAEKIHEQLGLENSEKLSSDLIIDAFLSIPGDMYPELYKNAYDNLCVKEGGILIQPATCGTVLKTQCSYPTEEKCHDAAPWIPTVGLEDDESIYTEWRRKSWFDADQNKIKISRKGVETTCTYDIPASGACTLQSPEFHLECNKPVKVRPWMGFGKEEVAYYTYDRSSGNCQTNDLVCRMLGLGKSSGHVRDDVNGIDLSKCQRSHVVDFFDSWIFENIVGMNVVQEGSSCLASRDCCNKCSSSEQNKCLKIYDPDHESNNNNMCVKPT
jgi:hypothetical protein